MFEKGADWLVYQVLGIDPTLPAAQALHFFIMDLSKIFFLLITVMYIMGWLRTLVAPEKVRDYLQGKPRFLARILAVGLGSVTPFCSCSSVPLFIGFVEAGIPLGITFSFLIASPIISELVVVLLWGAVGWKITMIYVLTGVMIALAGGAIIELFRPERWVEDYVWAIRVGETAPQSGDQSLSGRHRYAMKEVRDILSRIWLWVIIGVGAGSLFHGFFPVAWVDSLSAQGSIISVPLAVLLGIPLYSNAVGVIPLGEAMLGKGMGLGTTLAFMMSVAAISLPEILILKKVLKWQALALFIAVIAVSMMLAGWIFNLIKI